ncbi:MAG: hypothetical protein ACYCXG_09220 [Acidiferrobacter sp.]
MATLPSSVHAPERERLAPPGLVLGLAAGVLLTLAILFDPQAFMARVRASGHGAVTLYFMQALLASTDNNHLRLLLTRREIEAGHYSQALRTLKPLIKVPSTRLYRQAVRWLTYSDLLAVTFAHPAGSPARRAGEHQLRLMIPTLRAQVHGLQLEKLARDAISLHDGTTAIAIYEQLAAQHIHGRAVYYGLAARAAVGLQRDREAATLYFGAQAFARAPAHQRYYFEHALEALERHNEMHRAVRAARAHLGGLGADASVLRFLVALARRADEPRVAAHYARELTQIHSL